MAAGAEACRDGAIGGGLQMGGADRWGGRGGDGPTLPVATGNWRGALRRADTVVDAGGFGVGGGGCGGSGGR